MDILDLGPLDGSVLLFGGPYGNLHATEAMRAQAQALGIPASHTICTGDVVAYCAHPQQTIDTLRDWGVSVVLGNCEESLGSNADDCGCGFEDGSACDVLSAAWYTHAATHVTAAAKAWMRTLPNRVAFTLNGARFTVVHGAPSHISRFVFQSAPEQDFVHELDRADADAVIGGHCGLPFLRRLDDGRLWLGAGVIGMPANDGTPRTWYALLQPGPDGIAAALHALDYDHAAAAAQMRADGLPEPYARCLETGLWPNMDILPASEHVNQGRALSETTMVWHPPKKRPRAAQ